MVSIKVPVDLWTELTLFLRILIKIIVKIGL